MTARDATPIPAADGLPDNLRHAVALLRADVPEQIMGVPQDWPRWGQLLAHVLAATTHPVLAPSRAGRAVPRRRLWPWRRSRSAGRACQLKAAWLLDRAATYLQVQGQPGAARPHMERALAIDEAVYGPTHPSTVIIREIRDGIARELQEGS